MSGEWGPWIEHDGAEPQGLPRRANIQVAVLADGISPEDGTVVFQDHPSFFWRWRRVRTGWFRSELRPVCDDPAYAPIIAYRIRRPDALRKLIDLAANPPAPSDLVLS